MNNLILSTNRSGSTILSDIISYADGSINLGEVHSLSRPYIFNTERSKQSNLYKEFTGVNLQAKYYTLASRGQDYIGFFKALAKRLEVLKQASESWTAKCIIEKKVLDVTFVDYCVDNNMNIFMTHRKDIVGQYISFINARYRQEVSRQHSSHGDFIYTNKTDFFKYKHMEVNWFWLHMYTDIFLEQLILWRMIYDKHKSSIKIISYEDHIKKMDFTTIGITEETVNKYRKESQHLVPTPYNTTNLIVSDDHPAPILGAWKQCLYLVNKHKYLVEI